MKKFSSRTLLLLAWCTVILLPASKGGSQTFSNLDFEQAQVDNPLWSNVGEYWYLPGSQALPFWQAHSSFGQTIIYDSYLLDGSSVGVYDSAQLIPPTSWPRPYPPQTPLSGNFSAYLHAEGPIVGTYFDAGIAQTGVIPADAKSVQFLSSPGPVFDYQDGLPPGMWEISVSLNGTKTTCYKLEENSSHIRWGADVSGLAGTLTDLQFTLRTGLVPMPPTRPPYTTGVIVGIDEIVFSELIVPEPSMLNLSALAAGLFLIRRRK